MGPFEPLIALEIEPKTKADQENLSHGLQALMTEDPMFRVHADQQTGRATIIGMGELQLEIIVDRLKREFNVEATVGTPQVAYKETLTRGVLSGYPIDDVRIEVYDGSYHDVDSSEAAFRIAGAMAFQSAAKRANPMLLEPVMRVEVVVPKGYMSDVMGNLASRRGQIQSPEDRGGAAIIAARVPLSQMLGYATDLRSRTEGRATYSMLFDGYEPLHGGPERDDEDRSAPVTAPRAPMPRGKDSAVALPEPDDEGLESAR